MSPDPRSFDLRRSLDLLRSPRPPRELRPGDNFAAAAWLLGLACPLALAAWLFGAALLRRGVRRWQLAVAAAVAALPAVMLGPGAIARRAARTLLEAFHAVPLPLRPGLALVGVAAGLLLRMALQIAPVGIPVGLAAAAVNPARVAPVTPEFQERERRRRQREERRRRRKAERRAEREAADPRSPALGVSLGGDLDGWRIGDLVVPPKGQLNLAMLLLGQPGVGKSTAAERLAFLAAQEGRQLTAVDGKGDLDFAEGVIAAYLAGRPDARVRLFPAQPYDLWRGSPKELVNRLVQVWDFSLEAQYYREVAMTALRLALAQPGPPCASTGELVARLDAAALAKAWAGHRAETVLVAGLKDRLADVQLRVANLAGALGPAFDGAWAVEDTDLAVFSVPTMASPQDGDAAMRVLLADFAHYATRRKPRAQRALLLFDEFSALEGGRRAAINLVERARGPHVGVILAGQSTVALGDEEERGRLLAAASAVIAFRTPQPAELAALAGSERVAEAAWQADGDDLTGRHTITMRARARVDQDQVRAARTGEAQVISHGRVERVRILRTRISQQTRDAARQLVAGDHSDLPDRQPPQELKP